MTAAAHTFWQRLRHTRIRDAIRGRIDGLLDWRQIIAAAELPGDVSDTITQVVRHTRLWHIEKVDVARELVAHFQDGIDARRTVEELIDSFGVAKQAAQLIHRAKKRNRPWVWHTWRWGCRTIATILAVYVLIGLYLLTGSPSVTTDYLARVNQNANNLDDSESAWPLYRQAMAALDLKNAPKWTLRGHFTRQDEDWPKVVEYLNEHTGALELVRQASRLPGLGFEVGPTDESFSLEDRRVVPELYASLNGMEEKTQNLERLEKRWLTGTMLPQLSAMRSLARILSADAQRAADAGDGATAMADVIAILGLGRHCEETPFLVNGFVAASLQSIAISNVKNILTHDAGIWSDTQLANLAHRLAGHQLHVETWFDGERWSFYDCVQRIYTDDGAGDGQITFEGLAHLDVGNQSLFPSDLMSEKHQRALRRRAAISLPIAWIGMASRAEAVERFDRHLDRSLASLKQPFWSQKPETTDDLRGKEKEYLDWDRLAFLVLYQYRESYRFDASYGATRRTIETKAGEKDGALLGIALELYRRKHGDWPKSLDELSPKFLPSVPLDRLTGEPLKYQIVDDRPVVYSLGCDEDDDAGRVAIDKNGNKNDLWAGPRSFHDANPPDGDWVIWSTVAEAGESEKL